MINPTERKIILNHDEQENLIIIIVNEDVSIVRKA